MLALHKLSVTLRNQVLIQQQLNKQWQKDKYLKKIMTVSSNYLMNIQSPGKSKQRIKKGKEDIYWHLSHEIKL